MAAPSYASKLCPQATDFCKDIIINGQNFRPFNAEEILQKMSQFDLNNCKTKDGKDSLWQVASVGGKDTFGHELMVKWNITEHSGDERSISIGDINLQDSLGREMFELFARSDFARPQIYLDQLYKEHSDAFAAKAKNPHTRMAKIRIQEEEYILICADKDQDDEFGNTYLVYKKS